MPTPDTRWGDNIEDRLDSGDERMERIEADLKAWLLTWGGIQCSAGEY